MNLWLVPVDEPSFQQTLAEPIDLSDWDSRPESFPEHARVWGVRTDPEQGSWERNRRNLERMERGDLVLFYQDSQYIGVGFVGITFEDKNGWIRTTFWEDAPSTLIYTIDEFTSISVPRSKVNRIFDYTTDYYPQGLTRVADNRVSNQLAAIKLALEKAFN